jgi:16S rRNA (uracil1498-N3)-methyltransferase
VTLHRFLVSTVGEFTPEQEHQLHRVLRLRAGDRVRAFDGVEPIDHVLELSDRGWQAVDQCAQAPEPRTRMIACPALLQRDKFETVLQKLTELGVAEIVPTLTERCLVRTAPDHARLARWRAIVREATEQCGRGRVPMVHSARPFGDALANADGAALLAYEREPTIDVRAALVGRPDAVSAFVGPEGGFTDSEVALAGARGARLVTLGARTLRAETASAVLAALVLYELGDLSSHRS